MPSASAAGASAAPPASPSGPSSGRRTAGRGPSGGPSELTARDGGDDDWPPVLGAADAVDQLRTLQAEYQAWRDQLPESLADSRTAELLEGVCDVDLDALDVELPRGFGRD